MPLKLDSLKKSIESLGCSINAVNSRMDSLDNDLKETVRAGVIQKFEVAYEQCWKMIQRWIKENKTPEDAENQRTRKELFRMAARYSLIEDPLPQFEYGKARNLTSHTYDEEQAVAVYQAAQTFLGDAEYLLGQLEKLND